MEKDKKTTLHPFEAAKVLMCSKDNRQMSFQDKLSLFFVDFALIPLLIFENYTVNFSNSIYQSTKSSEASFRDLDKLATCADLFSLSDNLQ